MRTTLPPHDLAHVFTRHQIMSSGTAVLGVAGVGVQCDGYGLDNVRGPGGGIAGFETLTHEIAHNLGISHDVGGTCVDPGQTFLMWGSGSESNVGKHDTLRWSPCSKTALLRLVATGAFSCLTDFGVPENVCGNGVVEPGETCDCGALDCSSIDSCCDGATCVLAVGAICAPTLNGMLAVTHANDANHFAQTPHLKFAYPGEGAASCCDANTCALKSSGTVCRSAASGTCDVQETCDGTTAACPADAGAVVVGTACADTNGDRGACWGPPFVCVNRQLSCSTAVAAIGKAGLGFMENGGVHAKVGFCGENAAGYFAGRGWYDPAAPTFTPAHCANDNDAGLLCFEDATKCDTSFSMLDWAGAQLGFPCGAVDENGVYGFVCDGGAGGPFVNDQLNDGYSSRCVSVASLTSPPPPFPPPPVAGGVPSPQSRAPPRAAKNHHGFHNARRRGVDRRE